MKKLILMALCLATFTISYSQESKKPMAKPAIDTTKVSETEQDTTKKEKPKEYIKDKVKSCEAFEGLFAFYQDSTSGKMMLKIKENQLNKEFIHFMYVENGLLDAGYFKGAFQDNKIIKFSKHYENIEISVVNDNFYFDPNNPVSKASNANISDAIIASTKIISKNEAGDEYLIEADGLFLSETLSQIVYAPNPKSKVKNPFKLGGLSKEKTKYASVKNYPENSDVRVLYVFDNKKPTNYGSNATSDARSTSILLQHSLIAMPKNSFKARRDDARVGYFMTQVNDQTSSSATPYKDMIHRWHLVKKNPGAAMSEPVEPITWWIENTTPMELRQHIKEGVESWNLAFEKAGFKNAVVVKTQPDNAIWDAGDIRYNVLRWTSSPRPPFGGYGPSFVNPRTGQILGADVMLEYVFLTNRQLYNNIFDNSAASKSLEEHMFEEDHTHQNCKHGYCSIGSFMTGQMQFGKVSGEIMNMDAAAKNELIEEGIKYLSLHEVGHTLGLNHNMRSSQYVSYDNIHNEKQTSKTGLIGSVMDYPALNISKNAKKQGDYYTSVPGPYDHWAIEYGYSEGLGNAMEEEKRLEKILSKSSQPELTFGNDADDMRSPGRGIDPTIMIGDLSGDAISYGVERIELVYDLLPKLKGKMVKDGDSYQLMKNGYNVLMGQQFVALGVISRYVGGVTIDRSRAGQNGGGQAYTPIAYADQKRAMEALSTYAFAPDALKVPEEVLTHLQNQRRGFNHWGQNEDPKLMNAANAMYKRTMAHLLHPNVMARLTNSSMYGNKYSVAEMLGDLTTAAFAADINADVNPQRQALQVIYTNGLLSIVNGKSHDNASKAAALMQVKTVEKMCSSKIKANDSTEAHKAYIQYLIEKGLDID